ncbi:DUF6596 domain-containing protein [Phenylobacterium sp.]|uniref:RNA polymerase sigma factor n=1 Tax=Phenylobacterium sp. TaxID=1871053 RepID=UPI00286BEC49|nr:DUF6596 domain-containing protein [Phenylobacterium sp.]
MTRLDTALLRTLAPTVLGVIARRFGDFAAAEDAVQEALLAAARQWPRDGAPINPAGWLVQVAARRMADQARGEAARRRREAAVALDDPQTMAAVDEVVPESDDTLLLLFMCCHPALTPASAIALTLRAVGGLTTAEIAKAFLVPEATMAQRISRAKQTIKASGVAFAMPTAAQQIERLGSVLHILYLIFSEGYASSIGPDLQRRDLANEAIRLTRAVQALRPNDGEVAGLLALMLLTDARRPARSDPDGGLIPLADQDRRLWDGRMIAEGVALISRTLPRGPVGPYQIQAAIAAVHDEAARAEDTDWRQILILYDVLSGLSDNPMVRLNQAVAAAMVHGPRAGLDLLDAIDAEGGLAGHHRLTAVRAHLLEMAGDRAAAIDCYLAAAGATTSLPERNYLNSKAAKLGDKRERQ